MCVWGKGAFLSIGGCSNLQKYVKRDAKPKNDNTHNTLDEGFSGVRSEETDKGFNIVVGLQIKVEILCGKTQYMKGYGAYNLP